MDHRNEKHREQMFNAPGVVIGLILMLGAVHALRGIISSAQDAEIIRFLAFVPARLTAAFDPQSVMDSLVASTADLDSRIDAASFFLGQEGSYWWTLLTYGLLHGDWTHFGFNAIWLLAFGTPVARRFGAVRFIILMCVTSIAGALAHYAFHPVDIQPVIGASGAVAGAMGAAGRFVFQPAISLRQSMQYPHDMVQQPALPLRFLMQDKRVVLFVGLWFATNLIFGVLAPFTAGDATIAWQAHMGGFLAGFLLFPLFDPVAGHQTPNDHVPMNRIA